MGLKRINWGKSSHRFFKMELIVLLLFSVMLNIAMYRRLYSTRENVAVQAKEKPQAIDAKQAASVQADNDDIKEKKEHLFFENASFECTGDPDGTHVRGRIYAYIRGLRYQKNPVTITIKPEIEEFTSVTMDYNNLTLNGIFKIGESYTVIIPKGTIIGNDSTELEDDYPFIVTIKEPAPKVEFATAGPYYPAEIEKDSIKEWQLPIKVLNTDKIKIRLWHLENYNLDISSRIESSRAWWCDSTVSDALMQFVADKEIEISCPKNRTVDYMLDMNQVTAGLKPGVYGVAMTRVDKDGYSYIDRTFGSLGNGRLVILSDLGISSVLDEDGRRVAVAVRRLSDGSAVKNADISVVSLKRHVIAKGRTDKNGTVLLKYADDFNYEFDHAETVIASYGDDVSYIRLDGANSVYSAEFENIGDSFNRKYYVFTYTERGIYRPGETVHCSLFTRERKGADLLASEIPMTINVTDNFGNVIHKTTVSGNADGYATFDVALSPAAVSGNYYISCFAGDKQCGNASFMVGAFMPDRIKLQLNAETDVVSFDENAVVTGKAEYYFGGEATDTSNSYNIFATPEYPKHWNGYSVGNADHDRHVLQHDVKLETPLNGKLIFDNMMSMASNNEALNTVPLRITVEVNATEKGASTVTGQCQYIALPSRNFLGLSYLDSKNHQANIQCRMLAWDKDEKISIPENGLEFDIQLVKKEWEYVKTGRNGNIKMEWQEKEETVEVQNKLQINEESSILSLNLASEGHYILTASNNAGLSTKIEFWHYEGDAGSIRSSNPNILSCKSDKDVYMPGDVATLTFHADDAGSCFVTAGEAQASYVFASDVVKGDNSVKVKIPEDIATDNCFAYVTVVGLKNENITRRFGIFRLNVDQTSKRLAIAINAPEKAEPKSSVDISVTTANAKGKPVSSLVHVFAVDEGILSLTKFKTPDIFSYFHTKYACGFEAYDMYGRLFPKLKFEDNSKTGGGAGDLAKRLENLVLKENAIVMLGTVKTGKDGSGTVKAELPDFTGAMRIMAVGAGSTLVGSAEANLTIRSKASVLTALPVALAPNDSFTATYKIFNNDLSDEEAILTINTDDAITLANQDNVFKNTVKKGESISVAIPMKALANGAHDVSYTLQIGNNAYSGKDTVNVRPAMPFITHMDNIVLEPGQTLELKTASDEWVELKESDVVVSASPALCLLDALDWLNSYPYGCLEQTTSGAFPFLNVDNLVDAGIVDEAFKQQAHSKVEQAVIKLLAMKRGSKGFVGWIDTAALWDDVSIYATHFLFKADTNLLTERTMLDLQSLLSEKMHNSDVKCAERAYAFYVRTLKPVKNDSLMRDADMLLALCDSGNAKGRNLAKFFVGAGLYNAGFAARGVPLVREALEKKVWDDADGMPWMFQTKAVRVGIVLGISMEIIPENHGNVQMAFELANTIRKDGSAWGNTKNNAFAAYGLGAFAAAHKNGSSKLFVASGNEAGRDFECKDNTKFEIKPDVVTVIKNIGSNSLFVRTKKFGVPMDYKMLAENSSSNDGVQTNSDNDGIGNIRISKQYLDMDGKPVSEVKHGDLVVVCLKVENSPEIEDAVLLDLIPGGFAIEDGSLATRSTISMDWEKNLERPYVQRTEKRDDRFIMFGNFEGWSTSYVTYHLRAVTPGTYAIPPASIEGMYDADRHGLSIQKSQIVIKE